jgi:hypothetical protein
MNAGSADPRTLAATCREMREKLELPWKYRVALVWIAARLEMENGNTEEGNEPDIR